MPLNILLKVFCGNTTQPQLLSILGTIQDCLRSVQPVGLMNALAPDSGGMGASGASKVRFCDISQNEFTEMISSDGGVTFGEKKGIGINVGFPPTNELWYSTPTCEIEMEMGRIGWRESESLFASLLKEIVLAMPCELAFVCIKSEYTHAYPSPLGIRAGLADLYWITVFGREYVDLIGPAAFARLQAYENLELAWGGRWLQVTDSLVEASSSAVDAPRGRAKIVLGEDLFFVAKKRTNLPGARSFFDPRFWLALKRNVVATEQSKAKRAPIFKRHE